MPPFFAKPVELLKCVPSKGWCHIICHILGLSFQLLLIYDDGLNFSKGTKNQYNLLTSTSWLGDIYMPETQIIINHFMKPLQ